MKPKFDHFTSVDPTTTKENLIHASTIEWAPDTGTFKPVAISCQILKPKINGPSSGPFSAITNWPKSKKN